MILSYLIFLLGFVLLILGGNYLVEGASSLAKHFRISDLVIGLTIVSFGTSAPELTVNVVASLKSKGDITLGNIIGSNIVNILLILGISSIISPISVKHSTVWKEIPLSLLAVIVLFTIANDSFIDNYHDSIISRSDGIILISFLVIFLAYVLSIGRYGREDVETPKYNKLKSFVIFAFGILGLIKGGDMVVASGVEIARGLGVSEALIGFSLIAIGTGLPELFTSAIAAYKKNSDIAIGNIVGSNIFNIFWILGVSAIINPIPFSLSYNFDISVLAFSTSLLFTFMFTGKKHTLHKLDGFLLLTCYLAYCVFIFIRG